MVENFDLRTSLKIFDGSANAGRPHLLDETYRYEASFLIYSSVEMWYNFTNNYMLQLPWPIPFIYNDEILPGS